VIRPNGWPGGIREYIAVAPLPASTRSAGIWRETIRLRLFTTAEATLYGILWLLEDKAAHLDKKTLCATGGGPVTDMMERLPSTPTLVEPGDALPLALADSVPPRVFLWRCLVGALRDDDIEQFIVRNKHKICSDAHQVGVDPRDLETQIRLHLPSRMRHDFWRCADEEIYEKVRLPAVTRSAAIREAAEEAEFHAYASFMLGREIVRRDQSVTRADGLRRELEFRSVSPDVGQFYQSKLHYLRSVRCDTSLELGMYLKGARYPLTYLSFSVCDRPYIIAALRAAGIAVERREVLVLTRMYGLPGTPRNMMSLSIGRAARTIRESTSFRYVVTAFNPMLGFGGTVFLASGFTPFATAPVTYNYNASGMFSTRRQSGVGLTQTLDTPNNVLAALGVDKVGRRSLLSATQQLLNVTGLTEISHNDYTMNTYTTISSQENFLNNPTWQQCLADYRKRLEAAWSDETMHPGYTDEDGPAPPSRGQCGVSSVWLALELYDRYEVDPTYCYGKLSVEGVPSSIDHHCWLEIGGRDDPHRIIIDLTCDQAEGLEESILCGRYDELIKEGVRYEARSRLCVNELGTDRVWPRFKVLQAAVNSWSGSIGR
jgi:hypothetical protein